MGGKKILSILTKTDLWENTRYVHKNYEFYHYFTGKHMVHISKYIIKKITIGSCKGTYDYG